MGIGGKSGSQYCKLTASVNEFSLSEGQTPVSQKYHKGNYFLALLCIHTRYLALFAAVKGSRAIDQVRLLSLLETSGVLTRHAKSLLELSQVHTWFARQFEAHLLTPSPAIR